MTPDRTTTIDGWLCREYYVGQEWGYRTANRGAVEWFADADGLRVDEVTHGWSGGSGTYGIPANVFMWLAQGVRL